MSLDISGRYSWDKFAVLCKNYNIGQVPAQELCTLESLWYVLNSSIEYFGMSNCLSDNNNYSIVFFVYFFYCQVIHIIKLLKLFFSAEQLFLKIITLHQNNKQASNCLILGFSVGLFVENLQHWLWLWEMIQSVWWKVYNFEIVVSGSFSKCGSLQHQSDPEITLQWAWILRKRNSCEQWTWGWWWWWLWHLRTCFWFKDQ